jgi:hypothetical protein
MSLDPSLYILALITAFVLLNAVCWAVLRRWPNLLLSENERLGIDYLSRFEGELKPYIPEWFDIKAEEWPDFCNEYRRLSIGANVYEAFVEFGHPPFQGRFLNTHPAGFRHVRNQGPWPPSPQFFNIFFFGGSTALNVGPDWTSIPSFLQAILNNRRGVQKPIRVYNFGRGAWFSTQERILLQQILLANVVPDMVFFLDGLNEFFFFNGEPATAGLFRQALAAHNHENDEKRLNRLTVRPQWQKLKDFLLSLPLAHAVDLVGDRLAGKTATAEQHMYRPIAIDPALLLPALVRWLGNRQQIEAICATRQIPAIFVWQPVPAYKYDLRHHIALNKHYGFGGHERSGQGYELMAQLRKTNDLGPNFIWLADIQENEQRALYLDSVHYTTPFNLVIAQHIADAVFARGFLAEKQVKAAS